MTRTLIRQINLRRWFPPEDAFATCMARMTILREDFYIEMMGIYEQEIAPLDANERQYRQVYFWRNMLRTLLEIRSVLVRLNSLPEFREALDSEPVERQREFQRLFREFERRHKMVKALRNEIGGHVLHDAIQDALNSMSFDKWGFLEAGKNAGKTHYRFAGEILLETQLVGLTEKQRERRIKRQMRGVATFLPVFSLMAVLFVIYSEARKLDE